MDENPISNPFDADEKGIGKNPIDSDDTSGRQLVWLLLGIIVIGCGLLFAAALFYFQPDAKSIYAQYFPSSTATSTRTPTSTATITPTATKTLTPTPTFTSTPDYVLTSVSQGDILFEDPFDTNENKWSGFYGGNTVTVEEGKLSLLSDTKGYIGIALCASCPYTNDNFFLQADISSEVKTSESYGLAFCSNGYSGDFYVFQLNQQGNRFDFYKHSDSGWETLAENKPSQAIMDFPSANTVGVYFDQGVIKLYINNELVFSFEDKDPYKCSRSGFYVNDGGVTLLADSLIIYNIQPKP